MRAAKSRILSNCGARIDQSADRMLWMIACPESRVPVILNTVATFVSLATLKAEALLKELTELEGLGDAAKIKAKAKAMADKL